MAQRLNGAFGRWTIRGSVTALNPSQAMAVVSVLDGDALAARHTIVFEHTEGQDMRMQAYAVIRRLVEKRL